MLFLGLTMSGRSLKRVESSWEGEGWGLCLRGRFFAGTAARLSTRFCLVAPKGLVALTGSGGLGAMH